LRPSYAESTEARFPGAQYGAVLIDEGHDFEAEWLKLVAQMVDPETNSLLVLYDDAQSINRLGSRLRFSFAEVGIQARGRTTVLKLNYRNTAEVMAVACRFAREVLSPMEAEEDGIPLLAPQSAGPRGELPTLKRLANAQGELDFIVEQARDLHGGGVAWKDMAVLFRVNRDGERIAEHLAKAGIPVNLFGKSPERRKFRPAEVSIKLMTFHSSKGLEFPVVFIPFLEALPYMKDDVPGEAKLLYVAMTRAMERLFITHHGDSRFVAEVGDAVAQSAAAGAFRRRSR
jgi:superfamily I DNA/RNA helicase